jgi:hypothetical protein
MHLGNRDLLQHLLTTSSYSYSQNGVQLVSDDSERDAASRSSSSALTTSHAGAADVDADDEVERKLQRLYFFWEQRGV